MKKPTATYRLQFRDGMTFERARDLLPYLRALGISHVYASPIFTATTGSPHGYDVTDANEIDPVLGGREGFDAFSAALDRLGLGLILDIVPNHMAASVDNPWWRDVLRHGADSRYARHFDIDWSEPLTLPFLGQTFDAAVAAGEIDLVADESGAIALTYFDTAYPLDPASVQRIQQETGGDAEALRAFARSSHRMRHLHEAQHWRLIPWQQASKHLSYRRFFEVTRLVGVRVEDAQVFEDTHGLILDLVRAGQVQGLRVDHIDGLSDPQGYLERLRHHAGAETYIVVEKILAHGEALPAAWPVSGTTGYEVIASLGKIFLQPQGVSDLDRHYRLVSPETADFEDGLRAAKKLMVECNFEGEVARLLKIARSLLPQAGLDAIAAVIRELLIAFPVYRTYGEDGPLSRQDSEVLDGVLDVAAAHADPLVVAEVGAFLQDPSAYGDQAREFRIRFQQVSGPVMAKAMEDTLFYRHNRLLSANEVGGEPDSPPTGVETFHREMMERARTQPDGLSATSTHDTKRGEDARARLYAISEDARAWAGAVERWRVMNARFRTALADGPAPEPNTEWMLYQALAGVLPEGITPGNHEDLSARLTAYAEKAAREAKLRTGWGRENEAYEQAVKAYATALVSPENAEFLTDFTQTIAPFVAAGKADSLSQTLIKLTAPGIPDIYQGAEGLDLSLVDPDNRRPIHYAPFIAALNGDADAPLSGVERMKIRLIQRCLTYRHHHPDLFAKGDYVPLVVHGEKAEHVVAFARRGRDEHAISVASRLMCGNVSAKTLSADPAFWADTAIKLPQDMGGLHIDLLSGARIEGTCRIASVLAHGPVAFLTPE